MMSPLSRALRELIGLFIDDGSLALAILVIVTLAAALAWVFDVSSAIVGAVLLIGCVGVLVENVRRGAKNKQASP